MEQKKVYEAISSVMADMAKTGISKDNDNQQQRYKYRGIDDVYNALAPVMARHKLMAVPEVISRTSEWIETKSGGKMQYVTVSVAYDFVSAEDGSKHRAITYGEAMDSGDKATNKAMSAALKYACFQVFMIPTEGDNDADATTHTVSGNIHKSSLSGTAIKTHTFLIDNSKTLEELQKVYSDAYKAAKSSNDEESLRIFADRKDKKKAILEAIGNDDIP